MIVNEFAGQSATALNGIIDEWIHSERDRGMAKRRFLDGVTQEALAEEYDLYVQHTRTILRRCRSTITRHL